MKIVFAFDRIISQQMPLGVGFVAAMLKQHGHAVEYLPLEPFDDCIRAIRKAEPQIVAYSVSTGLHRLYLDMNRQLKREMQVFSLFGGPHPSYFPEIIEEEGVDAICVGEGEFPVLELVTALEKGEEPAGIENIHYKDAEGTIHRNPNRPFLQNLDELPFPDLDILRAFPDLTKDGIAYVIAGRGCPFQCNFCFNHVAQHLQEGKFVRMRGARSVLDEIAAIRKRFDAKMVAFQDDTFTLNKEWLLDFLPRYREEVGLPFLVHTRADTLDEESADALRDAGCLRIVIGLESGDDHIRNQIMNKRISTEDILRTGDLVKSRGMELITQNMFGLPDETVETVLSTVDLNIRCGADVMVLHFYQPYPRTRLAQMSEERGLYQGTLDDIPESNHWSIVLDLENRDEIEGMAKLAFYFVDYPRRFKALRRIFRMIPVRALRMLLIRYLLWLDQKTLNTPKRSMGHRWHPPIFPDGKAGGSRPPVC